MTSHFAHSTTRRLTAALSVAAMAAAGLLSFAESPASAAGRESVAFTLPGAHTWTVPAGVSQVRVDLYGAQGGSSPSNPYYGQGGLGANVRATVPVVPGEKLSIVVAGQGDLGRGGVGGGAPGGSALYHGAGGGGASRLLLGSQLVAVAAGGGGAAYWSSGGGSGEAGAAGIDPDDGGPGTAGLASAPGQPGAAGLASIFGCGAAVAGVAGSAGVQDTGGTGGGVSLFDRFDTAFTGGGGGGGGYYGGGGGGGGAYCSTYFGLLGAGGGGGGGSSYVVPSDRAGSFVDDGVGMGDGKVTVQYDVND
jgi:hypothetical protein